MLTKTQRRILSEMDGGKAIQISCLTGRAVMDGKSVRPKDLASLKKMGLVQTASFRPGQMMPNGEPNKLRITQFWVVLTAAGKSDDCPSYVQETVANLEARKFIADNPLPPATAADRDGQRSYGLG